MAGRVSPNESRSSIQKLLRDSPPNHGSRISEREELCSMGVKAPHKALITGSRDLTGRANPENLVTHEETNWSCVLVRCGLSRWMRIGGNRRHGPRENPG